MKTIEIDDPAGVLTDARQACGMPDAEFRDRVVALLEIIAAALNPAAFGAQEPERGCEHRHTEDHGVMGDAPGSKVYCLDCETYING